MSFIGENVLLRLYLRGGDRFPHVPTHLQILKLARKQNLAGATILKGQTGAGYHETPRHGMFSLTDHAPVIVEIVDTREKITAFIKTHLRQLKFQGLLTLERAAVMMYRHRNNDAPAPLQLPTAIEPLSTIPDIQSEGDPPMRTNENGTLIRVFIGESDKWQHQPLYEAILTQCRELGLAGATVLRGIEGFGANSVIHKSELLEMSTDLPIVIEIVDAEEKVKQLLPHLQEMVREGLITMEHVMVCMYGA